MKEKSLAQLAFSEKNLAWLGLPYQKARLSLPKSWLGRNTIIYQFSSVYAVLAQVDACQDSSGCTDPTLPRCDTDATPNVCAGMCLELLFF